MKPLRELVPDAKYPLRLVEADLSKADSWAKAVSRCMYVFHVASPFLLNISDEAAIIRTAVEGTTNVLQACANAGTVKRVVVTSSIAAVSCGAIGDPEKPADYVYTEKDWSPEAACEPYEKSKLKAEQAALLSLNSPKPCTLVRRVPLHHLPFNWHQTAVFSVSQ